MDAEEFEKFWTDTSNPSAFSSARSVQKDLERQGLRASYPKVLHLISKIQSYQQNVRAQQRFATRHIDYRTLAGVGRAFQADLFFLPQSSDNMIGGLLLIDEMDGFIYCKAIRDKKPETVLAAFKTLREEHNLKDMSFLLTDNGSEFKGVFLQYLKDNHIMWKGATGRSKAFMAERAILTCIP